LTNFPNTLYLVLGEKGATDRRENGKSLGKVEEREGRWNGNRKKRRKGEEKEKGKYGK